MKYWLLKGVCTPAHKNHAKKEGVRIVDARFKDRFKKDSIYTPAKKDVDAINSFNAGKTAAVVEDKE